MQEFRRGQLHAGILKIGKNILTRYHRGALRVFKNILPKVKMKIATRIYALLLWLALLLPASAQSQTEPAFPYSPSLDLNSIDKSIDPCVNFYQYACGRWQKNNPIPSDQTSWSVYAKLYQDNLKFLRGILDQAANSGNTRDAVTQEIGDFYAACIDEPEVERRGIAALHLQLDAISRLNSKRDLASLVAKLQLYVGGYRSLLFQAGSDQDPDNSEQMIAALGQGGLGLPDRDNYTKEDTKSKEIRDRYSQHVQRIFELLGDSAEAAKKRRRNLNAHGNRACQGFAYTCRDARSLQTQKQNGSCCSA